MKHIWANASLTVEGAWIISFCLIVIGMLIMLAYSIFTRDFDRVISDINLVDSVRLFKITSIIKK